MSVSDRLLYSCVAPRDSLVVEEDDVSPCYDETG